MAVKTKPTLPTEKIFIPPMDVRTFELTLTGTSPLICHAWGDKSIKKMRDKQGKKATAGREAKNPEEDFHNSLYHLPDGGYGFPAMAFKTAAVTAATSLDITKVATRQAFHVLGAMVPIISPNKPQMREDMVRVGMGTADIRYRGEFPEWSVVLTIRYNARAMSAEQIINLFNVAGFGVGIGEWRPERNGNFGTFAVATQTPKEIVEDPKAAALTNKITTMEKNTKKKAA